MVPCQAVAFARTIGDRSFHDIRIRSVVLDEIKVGSCEILERNTEITHDRHRLQKDFRQGYGGTNVEIDAATIQFLYDGGEQAKVTMRGLANACPVGIGMQMNDVGANRG